MRGENNKRYPPPPVILRQSRRIFRTRVPCRNLLREILGCPLRMTRGGRQVWGSFQDFWLSGRAMDQISRTVTVSTGARSIPRMPHSR